MEHSKAGNLYSLELIDYQTDDPEQIGPEGVVIESATGTFDELLPVAERIRAYLETALPLADRVKWFTDKGKGGER